jgi:uncharacterized membrane protein YqjE
VEDSSGGTDLGRRGIGASLRGLATGTFALLAGHVELIGVELQEERQRVVELAVLGACALVLFGMALLLATLVIVIWLWDSYRLESAIALTILYGALGACAVYLMRRKLASHPNPFAATVAELEKDRENLRP